MWVFIKLLCQHTHLCQTVTWLSPLQNAKHSFPRTASLKQMDDKKDSRVDERKGKEGRNIGWFSLGHSSSSHGPLSCDMNLMSYVWHIKMVSEHILSERKAVGQGWTDSLGASVYNRTQQGQNQLQTPDPLDYHPQSFLPSQAASLHNTHTNTHMYMSKCTQSQTHILAQLNRHTWTHK